MCLKDLAMFRPQLRAILRASAYGPVRMMIPMLSAIQEVFQVLRLVAETKQELRDRGLAFDEKMPVGGMIEMPAAAVCAPQFARYLDFLSIGTNDLIQYTSGDRPGGRRDQLPLRSATPGGADVDSQHHPRRSESRHSGQPVRGDGRRSSLHPVVAGARG
jgi:phosphoenolpyruvate synthase/pyruvate phosphate dikinase